MRRADRLFSLLLELRRSRVVTARRLAERLAVSERTVYRDIADLQASGVPVAGEAGVGYQLRGFDLPPLMFDREEVEAMVLGARVVEAWGDGELAAAAATAVAKIEAVLPRSRAHLVEETRLYVPKFGERRADRLPFTRLRLAIRAKHLVALDYADEAGRKSERTVRPLALAFHPPVWLLISWCELRGDFRNFRLDRIAVCEPKGECFAEEPGKTLADYLRRMELDPGPPHSP
jgi:predicted DNA-binding transcriptional regulator YafY